MKCKTCNQDFNPHDEAKIGHFDHDAVEVRTTCTHCGTAYYTFTAGDWVVDKDASNAT